MFWFSQWRGYLAKKYTQPRSLKQRSTPSRLQKLPPHLYELYGRTEGVITLLEPHEAEEHIETVAVRMDTHNEEYESAETYKF